MIKYFVDAFKVTNNNIILATPLILFMLLTTLYNGVFGSANSNQIVAFLGLITYFLMWSAFLAGWLYIVRQAVLYNFENLSREEKTRKSFGLMNLMLKGIGEYFLSFLGILFFEVIFFISFILLIHYIGVNLIGNLNIPLNDFVNAANTNSPEVLEEFMNGLPREEIVKLAKWIYLCLASFPVFLFFQMFWFPSVIKDTKNIFKAFWNSLKFIFKNFAVVFIFFIMIGIIHFLMMMICGLMTINSILSYFSLLVYFYFMVYIVVLVFLFYEKYEKKNRCDCGADGIGQDIVCDSISKED